MSEEPPRADEPQPIEEEERQTLNFECPDESDDESSSDESNIVPNKLNVTSLKKLVFFDVADVEFDTDEEESESFVTLPTNREYDEYGFLDDEADDLDHSQTVEFLNSSIKEEKVIEEPKDEITGVTVV